MDYKEIEITVSELLSKYKVKRPTPDEKWIYGIIDPLDDLSPNDIVILRKQK
ncbi:MAG: hypothetical protein IKU29_03955 [Parabacteroides sp.]|nr:hypothetical protein [Parabacteroides sp.]